MYDCAIVGGGAIGLMTAYELRQNGLKTAVFDKSAAGAESSWAGGGILSPLHPWEQPEAVLRLAGWSQRVYPALARELLESAGEDPQWIPSGMAFLANHSIPAAADWLVRRNRPFALYRRSEFEARHPGIRADRDPVLWLPDIAQIRPPRFTRALAAHLRRLGVDLHEHRGVERIETKEGRVRGVAAGGEFYAADRVVVAAGAWSGDFLRSALDDRAMPPPVAPVRGQMIAFQTEPGTLNTMAISPDVYLIPRGDGLVLAGSTVEHAGYDKSTTPEAAETLRQAAVAAAPALEGLEIAHHWSGLRPGSPEGIPFIGPCPGAEGLFINTGHYRNGLTLAPASARLLADLMLGRPPIADPAPHRFPAARKGF